MTQHRHLKALLQKAKGQKLEHYQSKQINVRTPAIAVFLVYSGSIRHMLFHIKGNNTLLLNRSLYIQ